MEGDISLLKVHKYKLIVKKWESDFRSLNGKNPNKNDIKEAPSNIKAAYKKYWTLKTNELEKSFLDVTFDDNAFDNDKGFNEPLSNENDHLVKPFECSKFMDAHSDSANEKIIPVVEGETTISKENFKSSETDVKSTQPERNSSEEAVKESVETTIINTAVEVKPCAAQSKENEVTKDKITESKNSDENDIKSLNENGWGSHLNRKACVPKKNNSMTKSASSHFLDKLFIGSKFKKKNPRKYKSFSRSQSFKSTEPGISSQTLSNESDGFSCIFESKANKTESDFCISNRDEVVENLSTTKEPVPFETVVNKLNINIKNTNLDLSNVRKSFKDDYIFPPTLNSNKKLDKGWLERCNVRSSLESKQNSFDSGIDVSENSVSNCTQNSLLNALESSYAAADEFSSNDAKENGNVNDYSSDEDLVFDSDSEGERSRSNFNLSQRLSTSRSSSSLCSKTDTKTNLPTLNKSISFKDVTETATQKNINPNSSPKESILTSSENKCAIERINSNPKDNLPVVNNKKRISLNDTSFEENRPFKRVKDTENVSPGPSKNTVMPVPFLNQKKEEILRKKLASGKANENFVRINIQKKVFVRGKKTMTNTKFKKQQWKAKKKLQNYQSGRSTTAEGDLQTCFKCNEIGHWARDCCKGQTLLPKEQGDDELDCPYPTLEEAEEIAAEMMQSAHLRKNQSQFNSRNVTESELPQPPENLVEAFSHCSPLFETNEDGSLIDTPLSVLEALLQFNHQEFRPGQEEAVMRVLSGKSTLVTLCTGAGKSLIYQLPAYMYAQRSRCITLVISPLISLMEDQILRTPSFLKAACLHTNQSEIQKNKILESLKQGDLNVLLVSPEAVVTSDRMYNGGFLRFLPPIAFACIDEAHCVSMWSHNFRPSYLMICQVLRERMGVKTILGLTASATQPTIESVISHLGITDGISGVIRDVPLPDNLILSASRDEHRDSALLKLIQGPRFRECNCIIVYCTRREECERLAAYLRTTLKDHAKPAHIKVKSSISWIAESYHAGLSSGRRRQVQNAFMKGNVRIVVATVAFGMGINKSDIRGIIHYNMPARCENYVQEVGRAGRDGLPAHCHLFLSKEGKDLNELRRHIYANSITRQTLRKLLEKVFVPCKCAAASSNLPSKEVRSCKKHEIAFDIDETVSLLDIPQENITTLLCYLEAHPKKWISLLPHSYTICKVNTYSGEMQLRKACKTCPPLAYAVAEERKKKNSNLRSFEFPVVKLAASIGWDSGIVKHSLNNVMWTEVNGKPRKSGVNIEFTNLGFRVMAPGNLSPDELDEALNSLHGQVELHEQTSLKQLQFLFDCLTRISLDTCNGCLDEVDMEKSNYLKKNIRAYFAGESNVLTTAKITATDLRNEGHVLTDIRNLIQTNHDSSFTGLAIARIFHGISSPNYPAIVWGRTRFWRSHVAEDFKSIVQAATIELIRNR